jgi:hypothetical protein
MVELVKGPYRHILSRQFEKDAEFSPRPSALVLVAGLEIVVRDEYGVYLLVISPQYEEIELPTRKPGSAKVEDGFWTVPYVTHAINAPTGGFKHVKHTIETIDREIAAWNPQPLLEDYLRTFSLGVPTVTPVGAFCELKHSWTQPHITKLYHMMRYSVSFESCYHRNLADAFSRGGFSFLPIDERYKTVTRRRTCRTHQLKETLYLEQPLATNLATVLEDEDERRSLCSRVVIPLERDHFVRDQSGLLFCGDIAGYGAASSYAEQHMGGLTDADHGAILRDSATVAFTDLFLETGISQIHIAGDGFICAMALEKPSEVVAGLKRFAASYASYLARLEDLNSRIAAYGAKNASGSGAPLLGSRLAVHYGAYRYGKMSQASSLVTSFDGSEIVRVSRLEQALRAVTQEPIEAERLKVAESLHTAAASQNLVKLVAPEKVILNKLFKTGGRFDAASKEYHERAWLLQRTEKATGEAGRAGKEQNAARKTARGGTSRRLPATAASARR